MKRYLLSRYFVHVETVEEKYSLVLRSSKSKITHNSLCEMNEHLIERLDKKAIIVNISKVS